MTGLPVPGSWGDARPWGMGHRPCLARSRRERAGCPRRPQNRLRLPSRPGRVTAPAPETPHLRAAGEGARTNGFRRGSSVTSRFSRRFPPGIPPLPASVRPIRERRKGGAGLNWPMEDRDGEARGGRGGQVRGAGPPSPRLLLRNSQSARRSAAMDSPPGQRGRGARGRDSPDVAAGGRGRGRPSERAAPRDSGSGECRGGSPDRPRTPTPTPAPRLGRAPAPRPRPCPRAVTPRRRGPVPLRCGAAGCHCGTAVG